MDKLTGKVNFVHDEASDLITLSFNAPGSSNEEHDQMANETQTFYDELKAKFPERKFKVLVNLLNAGTPTKHATDLYIKTLSDKQIEKTAFLGMSNAIQSIINFIVNAAGKGDNVKFFISEPQALEWLAS